MTFPTGVITAYLTLSTATVRRGGMLTVIPSGPLLWTATGVELPARYGVPLAPGSSPSVEIPATDQSGFTASNWTFTAIVDIDGHRRYTKTFALPTAGVTGTTVDLDLIDPAPSTSGSAVALPTVVSVNGYTGPVSLTAEDVEAAPDLVDGKAPVRQDVLNFNAKDYGATGDGTTADHAAIQAAVNAASTAGGGVVFLPAGTYRLTTRITLKAKVSIVGAGQAVTTVIPAAGVSTAIFLGSSGTPVTDAAFRDFTIDGQYATNSLDISGFQITNGARCEWSNMTIKNTGRCGILLTTHPEARIRGNLIDSTGLGGVTSGHAILLTTSPRAKVTGNTITNGLAMGVALTSSSTDVVISDNYLTTAPTATGLECIGIASGNNRATVSGNICVGSQDNGISMSANDSTVSGNTINGALNHGIECGGNRNAITGNTIKNCGQSGVAGSSGITLAGSAGSTGNVVTGNTIYDDQGTKTTRYGVYETVGANYNLVTGNVIRASDFLLGSSSVVGANTVVTNNIV